MHCGKNVLMIGLNIQYPWSEMLLLGDKVVETRSYPLPKRLEGMELALVETPGKSKKFKTRIVGTITFSHCFEYRSKQDWQNDFNRHKVLDCDEYCWSGKPKYGWVVSQIFRLQKATAPPKKRGMVYVKNCRVPKRILIFS